MTNGTSVPSATQVSGGNSLADTGMLGTPFAKVNSLVPGSPADQAGLNAGDIIRSFGDVHWLNHERLSKVAETVQQNEGVGSAGLLLTTVSNCLCSVHCRSRCPERMRVDRALRWSWISS